MRKALLAASALVCASLLVSSVAEAKRVTYIPVISPAAGSTSMLVFGINDNNIIAGSYTDSAGIQHGFVGPLDGTNYTLFDFAGDGTSGTQPRAIANDGSITGIGLGGGFTFGEEFFRTPDGTITVIKKKKLIFDGIAQGFNGSGAFVGDYVNSSGIRVGYEGGNGKFKKAITLPIDVTSTDPRQINNHKEITGSYLDGSGFQHGFTLKDDTLNSFDYPDAGNTGTAGEGINNKGEVSGLWMDSAGNRHGFALDTATGNFTPLDPGDGSFFQEAWGINNAGLVVLDTTTDGVDFAGYIYCPHRKTKCPKGGFEVEAKPIHVAAGTFLHYDKSGRTGHGMRPAQSLKKPAALP